ncbi:hypothetical protein L195_g032910, partial [Trifolium pratense]
RRRPTGNGMGMGGSTNLEEKETTKQTPDLMTWKVNKADSPHNRDNTLAN